MKTSIDNLASEYQATHDNTGTIIASHSQTVSSSSVDFLSQALNAATTHVQWVVAGADVNMALDGSTATTGDFLVTDGKGNIWSRNMAENTKCIRNDTTDATILVQELQKGAVDRPTS